MTDKKTPAAATAPGAAPAATTVAGAEQVRVKWNTSQLKSSYCNICNASSTREEVVLNFGLNQDWDRDRSQELEMHLLHRIILNPMAARRLHEVLGRLLTEHEQRYNPSKG